MSYMHKDTFRNIISIAISFFPILACSAAVSVDTVEFRRWDKCLRIRDGVASVIVNPEYGGHILYYGLDEVGDNVLWTDSVVNGWTLREFVPTRRSPDSGRFDIGNERKTENIHDIIWAGPYSSYMIEGGVGVASLPSESMGVKLRREYRLHDGKVSVTQFLTNIGTDPVEYCFWTRTVLPAGGIYMATAEKSERYANGFAEICLKADTLLNASETDRVTCRQKWFCAFPGGSVEHKYGINTEDGVSLYAFGRYLYKKILPVVIAESEKTSDCKVVTESEEMMRTMGEGVTAIGYDNNGGESFPNMIYFCEDFIEMEPNSPVFRISPGKTAIWKESWQLIPLE